MNVFFIVVSFSLCMTVSQVNGFEVVESTIGSIEKAFATGELANCSVLVEAFLQRIADVEPTLNAFITVDEAGARKRAHQLDALSVVEKSAMRLWCIPAAVKDNYAYVDLPTTVGSITLKDQFTNRNSFIVDRLLRAGAVILGKTNMAEFAMDGGTTNSTAGGLTVNAYDVTRTAMGSSGGTATAIAASMAVIGLGSDTQGSIQNPCGVESLVGLRPTQGLLSSEGIFPLAEWQDVGGPMMRTAEDLAKVMNVIDATPPGITLQSRPSYTKFLEENAFAGVRIGLLNSTLRDHTGLPAFQVDPEVVRMMENVVNELESLGATVVVLNHIGWPASLINFINGKNINLCAAADQKNSWNYFLSNWTTANSPVHSMDGLVAALERNPAEPRQVVGQVSNMVTSSVGVPFSAYYEPSCAAYRAWKVQQGRMLEDAMLASHLDGLLYPSLIGPATPLGVSPPFQYSFLSAASGNPAIVIPGGFTQNTSPPLPLSFSLMARRYQDSLLVHWAYNFDAKFPHRKPPPIN